MQEKRALGRGLSSLIPLGNRSDNGSKIYQELSPADIVPNQSQPRKLFDKAGIDELAASIEEKGIIQPLIVRQLGGGKYELIAGERRFRASQLLNLERIPVIIKDVDPQETLEMALIENIQRQDLNPVEEALAYRELLNRYQYTQDELAKRIGKDRSSVANMLRLLKLPDEIREHIIAGKLTMGHARTLLGIDSRDVQLKVAEEIIKNDLSVREIENWINRLKEKEFSESSNESPVEAMESTAPEAIHQQFASLEEEMKKSLKTMVLIKSQGKKGKIVIHFNSPEELDQIYQKIII